MSETFRRRAPRLPGLLASLVLVPVLLVVPAALPLCGMEMDACAPDVPVAPLDSHCPMDAAGVGSVPCCVEESLPQGPAPAVPGKANAEDRVQPMGLAPAPALTQAFLAAGVAVPAAAPSTEASAPAVPLYTLLSTLLN